MDRLGLTQGSYVWSAKLSDPYLIDALEADVKKNGKGSITDTRPQLLGFDATAAGLLMLTNHLIALRLESTPGVKSPMIKGPVFPMEVVDERLRLFAKNKRMTKIEESQARYAARKAKEAAGKRRRAVTHA